MAADDKLRALTALRDLRPGMKNVTCVFIVIDKGTVNQTKDGSVVRKCRVADRSGSICFSLWNEQAGAIEPGDILRLTKGYASMWKGGMMLYSGKYGILEKIGEFTMVFSETPDMSDPNQDFLQSQQSSVHHQPAVRGGGVVVGGASSQHQPPHPPNSSGGGVYQNSMSPQGGPHNGRMGMGPGMNRNGNNHINQGMASGYSPHPPDGTGKGYSHSESSRFVRDGPSQHYLPNFSPDHRDSPPPPPISRDPQTYHPPTSRTMSEQASHDYRGKQSGGNDLRFPFNDHDEYSRHHGHYNGRTAQGGSRNLAAERPHPYSRPPADPPRHRGGWR